MTCDSLPNQAATSDQRNNYTNPTAVAYETYYTATGRVDHNLSSKHQLYGRFSWDFWEEEKDNRFDNEATETNGKSDYHAFQGRVERQMANGVTTQLAYTWSRLMTETNYLNNFDTERERVIGAFDRTHIFVASGLAELPFGRGRHWGTDWGGVTNALLGGWQISAIFKAQSGAPLGFGNFLLAEGKTVNDIALPNPTRERWYNVDAFNRVVAQQLISNVRTTPSRFASACSRTCASRTQRSCSCGWRLTTPSTAPTSPGRTRP